MGPKVNITLDNAFFFDATKFKILKGQTFYATLVDYEGVTDWFANKDQVLAILQEGNQAEITATEVGITRVFILDMEDEKIKELNIEVVDKISPEATSLTATVEKLVDKGEPAQTAGKAGKVNKVGA